MSSVSPSPRRDSRLPSPTTISVASLLNPLPHDAASQSPSGHDIISTPTLTNASYTPSVLSSPSTPSQQTGSLTMERPPTSTPKLAKDAPVFTSMPTSTTGTVAHPPFENFDPSDETNELLDELSRFQIFPLGKIATHGVRHIPYASSKTGFYERTGRESFEVFQYTFKPPPSLATDNLLVEKPFTVIWDYNIGLVRITPFFKCCGFSKTTPSRMLLQNPHLKDYTFSITGGSLAAQGYWLPFEAAKYICSTFCWHIRWALVPLFGPDFPAMCLSPSSEGWARLVCPVSAVENVGFGGFERSCSQTPPSESTKVSGWTPIARFSTPKLAVETAKRSRRQKLRCQITTSATSAREKNTVRRAATNKKRKRYPGSESSVSACPTPSLSPSPSPSLRLSTESTESCSSGPSPVSSPTATAAKPVKRHSKRARICPVTTPTAISETLSDEEVDGLDPGWLDHLHTLATLHRQPLDKKRIKPLTSSSKSLSLSSVSSVASAKESDDTVSSPRDDQRETSARSRSKIVRLCHNAGGDQNDGNDDFDSEYDCDYDDEKQHGEDETRAAYLLLELAKADAELAVLKLAQSKAKSKPQSKSRNRSYTHIQAHNLAPAQVQPGAPESSEEVL